MNKKDLEDRLINFAVSVIELVNNMPDTKAANHLGSQILRSGTSPALNYAEAQSGESIKDFIHKMKVVLKELRETLVCLKIIERAKMLSEISILKALLLENDELVSIFVKSVITAQQNMVKRN